jgi:hypothetical protein
MVAIKGVVGFDQPIVDSIHKIARMCEREEPGTYETTIKCLKGLEMGFAILVLGGVFCNDKTTVYRTCNHSLVLYEE